MCSRYVHTIQYWVQTVLAFSSKLLKDFNRNLHIRTIIFRICGFIFWHFKRLNFFNLYCRCQTSLWWGPRRRQTRLKSSSWKKKNFPKVFFLGSGYRANTHSHTIWEKYWRYTIMCVRVVCNFLLSSHGHRWMVPLIWLIFRSSFSFSSFWWSTKDIHFSHISCLENI